jgi:electron transfer flavoprotein beta subunit
MEELQIITCIKQVPDPEGPPVSFKIDSDAKTVNPIGIPPVISPFDENALEAALRIKDNNAAKITVISMGAQLAQPVLRKALGVGADELVLLKDPYFKDLDSFSTAYVLSSVIRKMVAYDIILTGRQAGDWDFGIVGLMIAEMLDIPSINLARKADFLDDRIIVEKLSPTGTDIIRASMPVLLTVSSEIGDLRFASIRGLQSARDKPVTVYDLEDLGVDPKNLKARKISKLKAPHIKRECFFVDGESAEEKGENLAVRLRQDRII